MRGDLDSNKIRREIDREAAQGLSLEPGRSRFRSWTCRDLDEKNLFIQSTVMLKSILSNILDFQVYSKLRLIDV